MNADLDETLKELGPDFRAVVDRLRRAQDATPERSSVPPRHRLRVSWWTTGALVAASLAVICSFVRPDPGPAAEKTTTVARTPPEPISEEVAATPYTLALSPSPAALEEIIRTQAPDGSWQSDYLTRQNAAALGRVSTTSIAYRKAVRYLRTKGLAPLTDAELQARGEQRKPA